MNLRAVNTSFDNLNRNQDVILTHKSKTEEYQVGRFPSAFISNLSKRNAGISHFRKCDDRTKNVYNPMINMVNPIAIQNIFFKGKCILSPHIKFREL